MQKHIATFALVFSAVFIGGCSWFADNDPLTLRFPGAYKIDIQQGNVITQEMVDQLRPGMMRDQIRFIMGEPLLPDSFNSDRWDYVYSFQAGGDERSQQILSLFFKDDKLTHFQGNFRPNGGENMVIDQVSAAANKAAQNEKARIQEALDNQNR